MSNTPGLDAAAWRASGEVVEVAPGRNLFVRVAGRGPVALLLHGYPSWSWDWSSVAAELEPSLTVVTPDLLGFGFSDKPRRRYTIAEQADLIEGLAARLDLKSVHLVAHDYGTIVAQELLDRRSRGKLGLSIQSVTLLNAAIVADQHRRSRAHAMLAHPIFGPLLARATPPGRWREGIDRLAGARGPMGDGEFSQFWTGAAEGGDRVQLHRMMHYIADRNVCGPRWEAALADFEGPLRLVWGMADPLSGAHVLPPARAKYPRAKVTELPGVGHWPQLEASSAVAAAILGSTT